MSKSWISDFSEGDGSQRELLGGKGAFLAEMTKMGLNVPPGFTVTTDACRYTMHHGKVPDNLWQEVDEALARLEKKTGRTFAGKKDPLLVSVRSGAKFSMPGMMDTVLNLGVSDDNIESLIEWSGEEHFAYDAYRRFLQMFSDVVLEIDKEHFEEVLTDLRKKRGVKDDSQLTVDDLKEAVKRYKKIIADTGKTIPSDPKECLRMAIQAVFNSWSNVRAYRYRRINRIPDELGTAANVQMMVFGDLKDESGTGVCFTRNPATGERTPYGDYLANAQGEDVVAGIRNTETLDDLGGHHPEIHAELLAIMERLEKHTKDMADIEFTIEKGQLWILQTRAGKRTAGAAVKIAVDMVSEGLIDNATAINRVDPAQLEQLERPRIDTSKGHKPVATGVAASPGAAQGEAIFDSDRAVEEKKAGKNVVLIRPETTPDDIHGMDAARGILTSQGGKTSHAAVVARGMGKPAVTGVAAMAVNLDARTATIGDLVIKEGDPITIDGTAGKVYAGLAPVIEPEPTPELKTLLEWADEIRTLGVRANADTPEDAAKARAHGAQGIGLARTEHMFMGERLHTVRGVILADDEKAKQAGLAKLRAEQVGDFEGILESMDGLPVIVRLLDPPLHEFLPSMMELEHEKVERAAQGKSYDDLEAMQSKVGVWEEDNPMLGLRGVRLGLIIKDLYDIQVDAAIEAVLNRIKKGGSPKLELMIPLVSTVNELSTMREMITEKIEAAEKASGQKLDIPIGTMIEIPRAALTAGEIAEKADFFSFGTNDLTQMTFGLSRDDAEGLFLGEYLERGLLASDPFQSIDIDGVGRLIKIAVQDGRATKPDLSLGICGEHGGDPASIKFAREVGLNYVSCSPPRVNVARLAAAQAEVDVKFRDA